MTNSLSQRRLNWNYRAIRLRGFIQIGSVEKSLFTQQHFVRRQGFNVWNHGQKIKDEQFWISRSRCLATQASVPTKLKIQSREKFGHNQLPSQKQTSHFNILWSWLKVSRNIYINNQDYFSFRRSLKPTQYLNLNEMTYWFRQTLSPNRAKQSHSNYSYRYYHINNDILSTLIGVCNKPSAVFSTMAVQRFTLYIYNYGYLHEGLWKARRKFISMMIMIFNGETLACCFERP